MSLKSNDSIGTLFAGLPPRIWEQMRNKNLLKFNENQLLTMSELEFKKYGFSEEDFELIRETVAKNSCEGFITVTDAAKKLKDIWKHITFGCSALDNITDKGITTRGLTEIAGESGSGKTQICLQLALTVQLPESLGGLSKDAVYICTEGRFPIKRLLQLANTFAEQHTPNGFGDHQFTNHIYVEQIFEMDSLMKSIAVDLPKLFKAKNIGLVIIDSIAAPFRCETNYQLRADKMRTIVHDLLALSGKYHCAIVCVNQVSAAVDSSSPISSNSVKPCLGLAWANLVTTRLQFFKPSAQQQTLRSCKVIFSSELPNENCDFFITTNGIVDTDRQDGKNDFS